MNDRCRMHNALDCEQCDMNKMSKPTDLLVAGDAVLNEFGKKLTVIDAYGLIRRRGTISISDVIRFRYKKFGSR